MEGAKLELIIYRFYIVLLTDASDLPAIRIINIFDD